MGPAFDKGRLSPSGAVSSQGLQEVCRCAVAFTLIEMLVALVVVSLVLLIGLPKFTTR